MKSLQIILFSLLSFIVTLNAQNVTDCNKKIIKGKELYSQQKYKEAKVEFESAKTCYKNLSMSDEIKNPKIKEISEWINKCNAKTNVTPKPTTPATKPATPAAKPTTPVTKPNTTYPTPQTVQQVETKLFVSPTNATFEAVTNTFSFKVVCDGKYEIDSLSNWFKEIVIQSPDGFTLRYESNPNNSNREDYFIVLAGNKVVKVLITQKPKSLVTTLSVDPTNLIFDADANSKFVKVICNEDYVITDLSNWLRVENKTQNGFTINYDSNPENRSRNDFFYVKSGDKTIKVNLQQIAKYDVVHSYKITDLEFGNQDAKTKIVASYDQELVNSNKNNFASRIVYNSNQAKRVTLLYKIIKPDGSIFSIVGGKERTSSFSYSEEISLKVGEKVALNLFGSVDINSSLFAEGLYTFEIWDENAKNKLISKYFSINQSRTQTQTPITSIAPTASTLSVSPTSAVFEHNANSKYFSVSSNGNFEISGLSYWFRVENKTSSGFTIRYEPNSSNTTRTDFFYVKAGDKMVRINVSQNAKPTSNSTNSYKTWKQYKQTFFTLDYSSCRLATSSYGFTFGHFGKSRSGFYFKALSNFKFKGIFSPNKANGDFLINGTLPFYSGNSKIFRLSLTVGYIVRLANGFWFNIGAGPGTYSAQLETTDEKWIQYLPYKYGPIDFETGFMIKMGGKKGGFLFAPSVTTTMFKTWELKLGLGGSFGY